MLYKLYFAAVVLSCCHRTAAVLLSVNKPTAENNNTETLKRDIHIPQSMFNPGPPEQVIYWETKGAAQTNYQEEASEYVIKQRLLNNQHKNKHERNMSLVTPQKIEIKSKRIRIQ